MFNGKSSRIRRIREFSNESGFEPFWLALARLLDANSHSVVDGMDEILLGAEVAFGGLDGGMAEQQLDLFQFPARFAA